MVLSMAVSVVMVASEIVASYNISFHIQKHCVKHCHKSVTQIDESVCFNKCMGTPEGERLFEEEKQRRIEEERTREPDVEEQRQALGDGGLAGRMKQIEVFSAWMDRHLQRSRERHGDPFTKPPFREVKKLQKP